MINNTFFSTAFDRNIMAVTLNNNKTFKEATSATCKALGYDLSELIGKNLSNILYSEKTITDLFSNIPSTTDIKAKLIKKDKQIIQSSISISKDDEKDEYYLIFQDLDIAQLHKNSSEFEIALNESEDRKDFLHAILNEQNSEHYETG